MSQTLSAPGPVGGFIESPGHQWCGLDGMASAIPEPSPRLARPRPPDTNAAVANATTPRLSVWLVLMLDFLCYQDPPRSSRHIMLRRTGRVMDNFAWFVHPAPSSAGRPPASQF